MAGKICVVTGGSSGYGLETARKLAGQGETVVITGRTESTLAEARNSIGMNTEIFAGDITSYADWERLKDFITGKYGRIDLLVNNAGAGVAIKPFSEQTVAQIEKNVQTNLMGVLYGCRAFIDMFLAQKGGTIMNITSVCAEHGWPGFAAYTAAKYGVYGFSKSLYTELRPHNIRVICMVPASSDTNFRESAGLGPASVPKLMKPWDFAEAVVNIFNLPPHIVVEHATVWGIDQECIPL